MRALILKTAMKLFLAEGFEKVTIRRIVKEIEYSPATVYLYFKDKDEILYILHREGFDELYKRQQAILAIKDPVKRLRKHAEIYITFALEKPEYYDLMFIMRSPAKKIKKEKEWEIGLRSYEFLKKNVKDCIDAGFLRNVNIDVATFTFWAHTHGMASLIIRDRCIMFPQDKLKSIIKASVDFVMESIFHK